MKSRHFVTPSPAEVPVIAALRKAGFLKETDGRMATFTCPMCQAIATYSVPSEQEPYGEVKCSCGLTLIQLLKELDMKLHEARCCPTLNISHIPIHEVVEAAEELLAETGKVVACGRSLYTADYRSGVLAWIDEADLTRLLSQYGVFLKHDARARADLPVDPPARMVHLLMSTQYKQAVPQVMGVVRQPFVLTDGSLCLTPGYHADLKVLAAFDPATFRKFAWTGKVSTSQAEESARFCEDLYREFAVEPSMKSTVLCAGLTAVQRGVLDRAPMILIQSNISGIGKSTLARVFALLVSEVPPSEISYPNSAEETGRTLFSALASAPACVLIDNIVGTLADYPALCTCLTEPLYESRVLRTSSTKQVSTRALFVGTGNYVVPAADMRRRVLSMRLVAPDEHPEQRRFEREDIDEFVRKHRPELVMHYLRIAAAYLQSGATVDCAPLSGLHNWSRRCREPIQALGYDDPALPMLKLLEEGDDDQVYRLQLLQALRHFFGAEAFTVSDIACLEQRQMLDALANVGVLKGGQLSREKLGWFLKGLSGFPIKGLLLERLGKHPQYRVKELK